MVVGIVRDIAEKFPADAAMLTVLANADGDLATPVGRIGCEGRHRDQHSSKHFGRTGGAMVAGDRYIARPTIEGAYFSYRRHAA